MGIKFCTGCNRYKTELEFFEKQRSFRCKRCKKGKKMVRYYMHDVPKDLSKLQVTALRYLVSKKDLSVEQAVSLVRNNPNLKLRYWWAIAHTVISTKDAVYAQNNRDRRADEIEVKILRFERDKELAQIENRKLLQPMPTLDVRYPDYEVIDLTAFGKESLQNQLQQHGYSFVGSSAD